MTPTQTRIVAPCQWNANFKLAMHWARTGSGRRISAGSGPGPAQLLSRLRVRFEPELGGRDQGCLRRFRLGVRRRQTKRLRRSAARRRDRPDRAPGRSTGPSPTATSPNLNGPGPTDQTGPTGSPTEKISLPECRESNRDVGTIPGLITESLSCMPCILIIVVVHQ